MVGDQHCTSRWNVRVVERRVEEEWRKETNVDCRMDVVPCCLRSLAVSSRQMNQIETLEGSVQKHQKSNCVCEAQILSSASCHAKFEKDDRENVPGWISINMKRGSLATHNPGGVVIIGSQEKSPVQYF